MEGNGLNPNIKLPDQTIDFKAAFEAMPGCSALLATDAPVFTILAATNEYLQPTGKKREEVIGKGVFQAFPPGPNDPDFRGENNLSASFQQTIASKQPNRLPVQRYDVIEKDGEYKEFYWQPNNKPVLDASGEVIYIIHTAEDVTDKIKAEQNEEKMKSMKQAHDLFMQAPVAIHILTGEDLIIKLANELTLKLWGKEKTIIGKPLEEALPEIKDQGITAVINEVIQSGKTFETYEAPVRLIRGGKEELIYANYVMQPYYENDAAKPVGVLVIAIEVTGRVMIEKELAEKAQSLKESSRKFETLLEASPQMTWTNLPAGESNFFNQKWFDYTGLSFDEIKEWGWKIFIHPDDLDYTINEYIDALQTGNIFENENRFKRADGEYRWHLNRALPIINESGEIILWVGTSTDIHDRKQTEQALRESEQRFQAAVAAVEGNVWTNNAKGEMEGEQPDWAELTGQSREDYQGYGWAKAVHPDDAQPTIDAWNEAVRENKTFVFEHRVRVANGSWRWFSIRAIPLMNENGLVREWVGVHTDITERRQAEVALRESDQRFQNLIREASVGIIVLVGEEMMVEIVNDAYGKLIGRTPPDLIKKPLFSIIPETEEYFRPIINNVRLTGEPLYMYGQSYFVWVNGVKKEGFLNLVYQPYKEPNGAITGVMVLCQDVTQQVLATKKAEESEQQIRSLVASAPFPIAVYTGKEMRVELANEAILNIWGKGSDVIGKLFAEILPELDNQQVFQQLDAVYTTGNAFHAKNQRLDLVVNGKLQPFYFNYSFTPLYNAAGDVYGVMNTGADVTDINLANQKAAESERNLRNIISQAPAAMCIFKGDDYVVEIANERMFELWGKPAEDVMNLPIFEGLPEAKEQGLEPLLDMVYKNGESFKAYERPVNLPRRNGIETVYINFVYEPLYDNIGIISGIMAVAIDVTEQVIARKKIEESEKEFRQLADSLPEMVWTTDGAGKQIFASARWKEFTGLDPYDTNTFVQIVHPDDWANIMQVWGASLAAGETYKTEVRLKNKEGEYHWFYVNGEPIVNSNGDIEKWAGAFTNINEQKKAEENLRLTFERFRALTNSMPQFVWTGDAAGNLNYFNKAVYDYAGLSAEKIAAEGWLQIVHPDDREENIKQWIQAVSTGKDFVFEHRFRRRDGMYRWQLSRAVPQKDAAGNIQMWVGTSTDIQEIRELDEQKDYFISLASHELKTPITSIKGYVQILQKRYGGSEDSFLKNSLNVVNKQIGKTTKLISDLLDVSKVKSGSLSLNKEQFFINQLINEIIEEAHHNNPDYSIGFSPAADALLYADKERIGQVLINLLSNAIKYSPDIKKVAIETQTTDTMVTVLVKDCGIGISKSNQEKIFERFYRVEGKNENTFPGFGIGLFIASEIIQRHHGNMGVESELGKGSAFYFSLPLYADK